MTTTAAEHPTSREEPIVGAPASFAIAHVRAVHDDRIVDDATVTVTDGRIAEIAPGGPPPAGAVDGHGAFLIPGVICTRRRDGDAPVAHLVLHRMEARSDRGWAELGAALPASEGLGHLPLLSFEDHSPGQGQFRDVAQYKAAFNESTLPEGRTVDEVVAERLAEAEARAGLRQQNLLAVKALAQQGRVRLLAHDLEDGEQVRGAATWGTSVAEFPLSRDAAEEARRCGLQVAMGAPNVLRGGSHSGNVSAAELVGADLCDALASDYQPSTMLAAAFGLAADGICSFPRAIALVTSGPAAAAGLDDRGRLAPGLRADLALVTLDGAWPRVHHTWRAADPLPAPTSLALSFPDHPSKESHAQHRHDLLARASPPRR
ncbi:hypothetical protein BH23ACT2_BH23ACT2_13520 [soil metagenome]